MCCAPNPPVNFPIFSFPPYLSAGDQGIVWGCEWGSRANWQIGRGSISSELAPVALGAKSFWALPEERERLCALFADIVGIIRRPPNLPYLGLPWIENGSC